ncbi:MAG: FG-GAP repeat domain-containing protein [Polyangia bacterium]
MRVRRLACLLCLVAGCGGGGLEAQGTVQTGGGSQSLVFAALGQKGAPPDVAAISAARGVVEVMTEDGGPWSMVGSFFAGGNADQIVSGQIDGQGAVAVKDQNGTVTVLDSVAAMPHRLGDPIQIYRRVRNGQPLDDTPPAHRIALGDLDGDGSDELLASSALGLVVVVDLKTLLAANPEHPLPGDGFRYDAGPEPGALTAVDLDGDGRLDVALLDAKEPAAYLYFNHGGPAHLDAPVEVDLPSVGVAVAATGCASAPAAVVLADGHLALLSSDGKVKAAAAAVTDAKQLASSRQALAVTSDSAAGVALLDSCAHFGARIKLPGASALDVALTASGAIGRNELAVLGGDGQTVSLFGLLSGF